MVEFGIRSYEEDDYPTGGSMMCPYCGEEICIEGRYFRCPICDGRIDTAMDIRPPA